MKRNKVTWEEFIWYGCIFLVMGGILTCAGYYHVDFNEVNQHIIPE